jgi:hypothetical protein
MIDRREDIAFNTMAFPSKLYAMLEDAEGLGFSCVVSWQPGGRSFNVHDQESFSNSIMQAYFSQTKFKSFQRQLNIYGWKKVQLGPNKGGYEHKNFVRGQPELCELILRKKEVRPRSREQQTESSHLSSLPCGVPLNPLKTMPLNATGNGALHLSTSGSQMMKAAGQTTALSESEVHAFYNFFYSGQSTSSAPRIVGSSRDSICENLFTLDPTPFNPDTTSISITKSTSLAKFSVEFLQCEEMNEIDDFISLLDGLPDQDCDGSSRIEDDEVVLATSTATDEEKMKLDTDDTLESDHSFPFKLHLMLDNAERENYSHIVSWVNGGTAFKVHDTKAFVDTVMTNYFDQSKYESFRRQLNLYQFKRVAKGDDRGVISHPNLIQGSRHLCKDITRKKNEDELLKWSQLLA